MLAGAFFALMQATAEWPMLYSLALNTLLILVFVAYIVKRDLPLSSLPVIGKKIKK